MPPQQKLSQLACQNKGCTNKFLARTTRAKYCLDCKTFNFINHKLPDKTERDNVLLNYLNPKYGY